MEHPWWLRQRQQTDEQTNRQTDVEHHLIKALLCGWA